MSRPAGSMLLRFAPYLFAWALLYADGAAARPTGQESLGKLFFTPEERLALDRQRAGAPPEPVSSPRRKAITGYVKRSDGKATVWIDRVPHSSDTPFDPGEVGGPPRIQIKRSGGGRGSAGK